MALTNQRLTTIWSISLAQKFNEWKQHTKMKRLFCPTGVKPIHTTTCQWRVLAPSFFHFKHWLCIILIYITNTPWQKYALLILWPSEFVFFGLWFNGMQRDFRFHKVYIDTYIHTCDFLTFLWTQWFVSTRQTFCWFVCFCLAGGRLTFVLPCDV